MFAYRDKIYLLNKFLYSIDVSEKCNRSISAAIIAFYLSAIRDSQYAVIWYYEGVYSIFLGVCTFDIGIFCFDDLNDLLLYRHRRVIQDRR